MCEGKQLGVDPKFDFEKTSLEMKDAIDHGLALRKRLTTVFGCQVKGNFEQHCVSILLEL